MVDVIMARVYMRAKDYMANQEAGEPHRSQGQVLIPPQENSRYHGTSLYPF
jgi:hypothetical protein